MSIRKTAFTIALPGLVLAACSTPQPAPPVAEQFVHPVLSIPPETDANIAVVEGYLNALLKADAAAIRSATAPGFYANDTYTPEDSSDVDGVIAAWTRNDSTRSDQKIARVWAECVRIAPGNDYAGDWVHYWGTYTATDKATGKPYRVPFFYDSRVQDGKITKSYTYLDRLSVYRQLGVAPPAPSKQ